MKELELTIRKQKNIALIAHDGKKKELIDWCEKHKEILSRHFLCGTGTTARMIADIRKDDSSCHARKPNSPRKI